MVVINMDLNNFINIVHVVFLFIAISLLLLHLLFNHKAIFYEEKKFSTSLKEYNMPVVLINLKTDTIVFISNSVYNIFNRANISLDDLFKSSERYDTLKEIFCDVNINNSNHKYLDIFYIQNKIYKIDYSAFDTYNRKYMVVSINSINTVIENYKKYKLTEEVLNNINEGVIITKINQYNDPIITYINKQVEKISGFNREHIIGKPLNTLFDFRVEEKYYNEIRDSINNMSSNTLTYVYNKAAEDKDYLLETSIVPIQQSLKFNTLFQKLFPEVKNYNIENKNTDIEVDLFSNEVYIFLYQKDITKLKQQDEIIANYVDILKGSISIASTKQFSILDCIKLFAENKSVEDILNSILKVIGLLTATDRSYIFFLKQVDRTNDYSMYHAFEWVADGVTSELNNPLLQDKTFYDLGAHNMIHDFINKKKSIVYLRDINTNLALKHTLSIQNIKSILGFPIYENGSLIAWIGLDHCRNKNVVWDEYTIKSLEDVATIISDTKLISKYLEENSKLFTTENEDTNILRKLE